MESIFKVGDVVRIRDLRELESKYGDKALPFDVAPPMLDLIGRIYIVNDVLGERYNKYDDCYKETEPWLDGCKYILKDVIDEKESKWSWSSPMLELVASAELYDTFTKDMVGRAKEDYKDTLEYLTSRLGFKRPTTTPSDAQEKKFELKVKSVKRVKLNFKN